MNGKIVNAGTSVTSPQKGDNADLLYTVPPKHISEIAYLTIANPSNSNRLISVQFYESESDTYYDICDETSIPANSTFFVVGDGERLFMNAGDKIVAAVTSNQVEAFVSVQEYFRESSR